MRTHPIAECTPEAELLQRLEPWQWRILDVILDRLEGNTLVIRPRRAGWLTMLAVCHRDSLNRSPQLAKRIADHARAST